MKRYLLILCSYLYFGLIVCLAQDSQLTSSMRRRMNVAVLDAIEKYEYTSEIQSHQGCREFVRMFESESSKIFCDLYSSDDFLSQVTAKEYASKFLSSDEQQNFGSFSYELKNIKKKNFTYYDNKWYCTIQLHKSINYFDSNLIYYPLPMQNPAGKDFELEFTFVFEDNNIAECRISEIRCTNKDSFLKLASEYYIVQKNDDPSDARNDENIRIAGKNVVFNEFGQGYAPKGEVSLDDGDVKVDLVLKKSAENYDYIHFKYIPKRLRLRIRNEFTLGSAYSISSKTALDKQKSSGYTIGLDFGYVFPVSKSFKMGVYAGLGLSMSKINLETTALPEYSYTLSDPQGNVYERSYSLTYASQGANFKDLVVPLYLSFEFRLHKRVAFLLDVGAKAYFNTVGDASPFCLAGTVSGKYADGTNVPGSKFGLGKFDSEYNEFLNAVAFRRKPLDICLSGGVGLDVDIFRSMLYVQARAAYDYGLTTTYESSLATFINTGESIFPYVYSGYYDRDIVVRPLADCVSFNRKALSLNLGVMLKF